MKVTTATVCDRGLVRAENQDSYLSLPEAGLFLVADGMGGGQGGAQASALVAETFRKADWTGKPMARLETVRASLAAANAAIAEFARREGYRQTGSTAAVLLLGEKIPGEAVAVWVGDSRVYRVHGKTITPLTSDHTVANELFGRMLRGEGGYSRSLPYAHVLTRALGVDRSVAPDAHRFEAQARDRYLLCSDGVHDMLADARIAEIVSAAPDPEAGCASLAEAIRAAGAMDNFTATLVFP